MTSVPKKREAMAGGERPLDVGRPACARLSLDLRISVHEKWKPRQTSPNIDSGRGSRVGKGTWSNFLYGSAIEGTIKIGAVSGTNCGYREGQHVTQVLRASIQKWRIEKLSVAT